MQQIFVSLLSISSHYFKLHLKIIFLAKPPYLDHSQRVATAGAKYHPFLGRAPKAFPTQFIQEILASHLQLVHNYKLLLV